MLAAGGAGTVIGSSSGAGEPTGLTAKDAEMLLRWAERAQRGARIVYFVPSIHMPSMARDCPRPIYNIVRWLLFRGLATPHYIGRGSGGPAYLIQRGGRPWHRALDTSEARTFRWPERERGA